MKILVISGTFPPRKFGGVTNISYKTARKLAELGHEVTVYTTDVGNTQSSRLDVQRGKMVIDGVKVYYFRNISNRLAFKHRLFLPVGMTSFIRKNITNFDIIHIHDYRSLLNVIIHHYSKKYGVPYVIQSHGSLPRMGKQGLKRLYDWVWGNKILKNASKVIALTEVEAEQYKNMGVDGNKIEIVPNGIDLAEYDDLPEKGRFRRKYNIKDNEKIILYLSRIHKIKGLDLLVNAFADLIKEVDNVRLVIVGPDDGFLSNLKSQIEKLGIGDKVLLTGALYDRDKLEAYIDADVYVLPSRYEAFPNTVLEAFACGTPVIVTDRCSIADIVRDKVGFVVKFDENQLANAILKLLRDVELSKEFGKRGRKLVEEKLNWDRIVEDLVKIYVSVLRKTNKMGSQ